MSANINPQRSYDVNDLKVVMENTRSWASSWDDVLHYLDGSVDRHRQLSSDAADELSSDIRSLKRDNVRFTSNYREIWNQLDVARKADNDSPPATASSRVADVMSRLESREYRELSAQLARERNARWRQ